MRLTRLSPAAGRSASWTRPPAARYRPAYSTSTSSPSPWPGRRVWRRRRHGRDAQAPRKPERLGLRRPGALVYLRRLPSGCRRLGLFLLPPFAPHQRDARACVRRGVGMFAGRVGGSLLLGRRYGVVRGHLGSGSRGLRGRRVVVFFVYRRDVVVRAVRRKRARQMLATSYLSMRVVD